MKKIIGYLALIFLCSSCNQYQPAAGNDEFPSELVDFEPAKDNPVFTGGGADAWDSHIRERGYILKEDSIYKLWYTGFRDNDTNAVLKLGYATSADGIHWQRHPDNPIYTQRWTEDMIVFNHEGTYYMYAEGTGDIAHYMTSPDGIHWQDQGDLVLLKTNGDTIRGPYGTPTAWVENGKWYLLYEKNDEAVWLATSTDKRTWKNVQDEPVLKPGPEKYDQGAIAVNQVVRHNNRYYLYYHANADLGWAAKGPTPWSSNVAVSEDLIHWKKYPGNPIVDGDHSSPITVFDGKRTRLYTMHPDVRLYYPR